MTNSDENIVVLNNLVQINLDRIEEYNHAYGETDDAELKELFQSLSSTSIRCNSELTEQVRKHGATPVEKSSTSGKIFRVWMDVKAAVTNKDRKLILASCEYGEDMALSTYEGVIRKDIDSVSAEQAQMIRDQYEWLKSDHDKVKKLRDSA